MIIGDPVKELKEEGVVTQKLNLLRHLADGTYDNKRLSSIF